MAKAETKLREHIHYHRNGTVWARGQMSADDVMAGYWEWFRKDGTRMRSGCFEYGEQVGEWTTYDRTGKVVKVTKMKGKGATKPAAKKVVKKKAAVKKVGKRTAKNRRGAT